MVDATDVFAELFGTPVGPEATGSHSCPGIRVALAEAEFALAEIAPLLRDGWQVVDVAEKDHFVFHGLTRAVIRHAPAGTL